MADAEDYEILEQPNPDHVSHVDDVDESNHSGHSNNGIIHEFEEDDLNPNDPDYPKPTANTRVSRQRPLDEKKINKKDFRKYRGLIKARLSDKQRMPFDQLISRNIHAGLEDELHEKKPMEKSKKILQLTRRLSHRPHPSDIQNDDDLPPDLKKADSEYYKLYKYRSATEQDLDGTDNILPPRTRTSSDPNPQNKPIQKLIKPNNGANGQKFSSIDNPLDWKFGQRSSTKELQIRGIIPEQYADVVHGGKSLEEAKQEWEEYRKTSSKKLKNKIDLKFRPTKQDLQDRGIVPDWENPNILQESKHKNVESLTMKLNQRMDPTEADQRAIISKDELFSNKDYEEHRKDKEKASKALKLKMETAMDQRAEKEEVVFRGIVPQEYLDEDADVAKSKLKNARVSVKQQMDQAFGNRPSRDDLTKLYLSASESNPVPIPSQPADPSSNLTPTTVSSSNTGYTGALPTTPEYVEVDDDTIDDYDFPTFLDRLKAEKKRTSQTLETHMKRRSTIEDLRDKGILPMQALLHVTGDSNEVPQLQDQIATQGADEESSDEEFVSFLDRMKAERREHRKSIEQSHKRRPTLENLMKRGIYKNVSDDLTNKPQVYMSDEYANSLNKRRDSEEKSNPTSPEADNDVSSEDDSQDAPFPTFLDRMREEKEQTKQLLEYKHQRRPSQQDLEDRGIVERGYFENMQVALTKKRQRRKSFTTELATFFKQRPDIAQMLTKGLMAAEFIGMDATEMAAVKDNKRQTLRLTLDRKLNKKRRPTMDDLEMRGIVPSGYFNDAQKAVSTKHVRRMTAETELHNFLPKRMDPKKMMERGIIPKQHFQNIMGMTIPVPTMVKISPELYGNVQITEVGQEHDEHDMDDDEDESDDDDEINGNTKGGQMVMNKQQQAFSGGAMGVAGVYAQKMVKQTIQSNDMDSPIIIEPVHDHNDKGYGNSLLAPKKRDSRRVSSGIANIVLDLPQHAERNLFNHDNWTQDLYESLLNSLRFGQIVQRIEKEKTNDNFSALANIMEKYHSFERLHHTKMNGLQRDKKNLLDQIEECERKETESLDILKNLMTEHASLEQKIRPQMKMLLHKMTLVEARIAKIDNKGDNMTQSDSLLKQEYEKELNYYDTYITELKNVFIHTNNIRSKYQNSIRTVMTHKSKLNEKLRKKEAEIEESKTELNNKFKEFHKWITSVTNNEYNPSNAKKQKLVNNDSEAKFDPLASDPITDLTKVLDEKNKNIDNNLDLLSFRISTIPATDYALRVIELCQLSYIYSSENLKSFFEWFIRFAVQSFIEINYAHTCFTTQNRKAIDNEINQLKSVKFIANLTPVPPENKVNFDKALFDNLTLVVSYLELLPSNNDNDGEDIGNIGKMGMSNNNIDHEYVIFHTARFLTADTSFSQYISSQEEEYEIPRIAQTKVEEWIHCILRSNMAQFQFSKDYNQIVNAENKPRSIIKATKQDSTARVRPARAAAIVMDHVYGIHVDG